MINPKICFRDIPVMLAIAPVIAFLVPIIFFGSRFNHEPYYAWNMYLVTLIYTFTLWLGNRYIMIWARNKYPSFSDTKKRLVVQSSIMLGFTLFTCNFLGYIDYLIEGVWLKVDCYSKLSTADKIINSNNAAIFCSVIIIAIYETRYFMSELKESVEETENLKRENLKAQLDALRTQVNPHFLFNNLNTLVSLIPEDPEQAVDFVQQLSKLYRHILEVKDEKSISLIDELEVLKAYAFLLKTRFGNNLEVKIDVPAEKLHKKIVPLSLQLLMENAIKHNIVSSDKPLQIHIFAENGSLVVNNNLQMKKQITESTSIGLDNIRNRYKLLGDKTVKVTETETNFTVSIPLIEN